MAEIYDELKALIHQLLTAQALLTMEQKGMRDDVDQIKHVMIEGNGTPPMTVRLAVLEHEIKRVTEDRADQKIPRHVSIGLAVSILFGVAGLLVGIFQ